MIVCEKGCGARGDYRLDAQLVCATRYTRGYCGMVDDVEKAPMHTQEKPWRPVPMEQRVASGTKSKSGLFAGKKLPTKVEEKSSGV